MGKKRYVATGDLVVDCYWKDNKLFLIDGGGSRFNVIAHLASRGEKTAIISGCGNDLLGDIAIEGLEKLNVDTTYLKRKTGQTTRTYHLIVKGNEHISQKFCPICGKKTWYEQQIADFSYCYERLSPKDILILDGLKQENIPMIKYTKNIKAIDIGRIKRLEPLSNQEILDILQYSNIEIMQLNEKVEEYLLKRFNLKNLLNLYQLFSPKLLVVTRGKQGADFVTGTSITTEKLSTPTKESDDTGAGDAFFSVVIQNYFEHEQKINLSWIEETFKRATKLTSDVVSSLGARGCLYDAYVPNNICKCICK